MEKKSNKKRFKLKHEENYITFNKDKMNMTRNNYIAHGARKEEKNKSENVDGIRRKIPMEFPIDKAKLKKFNRGPEVQLKDVRVKYDRKKLESKEKKIKAGIRIAALRDEVFTETDGLIEPEAGEHTVQVKQNDIQSNVDDLSACKRFDLDLRSFGPYRMKYSRNGRHLLIGGKLGHVAAFDWITKKLTCEMNVMEGVYDVAWLHQETLFAVAQKKWVYIYDNQGIEIHCLKALNEVVRMEYLPYHFLLSTVSSRGYLTWLDVSIGKIVKQFPVSARGTPSTIAHNPGNAHLCIGEPSGIVSFWTPNSQKAAITKWCHRQPIAAVAFDPTGLYFATSSVDRTLKLWDARNLQGPTQEFVLGTPPRSMSFSHRGILAMGMGNMVEMRREFKPYLRHQVGGSISNVEFCPFEDVLGVGHSAGFSSLLVPGSAEPNMDAMEINPFQSKSQRREAEVKALLEKIPADLISWDPKQLQSVHVPSLESIIEKKKKLLHVKTPEIRFTPKKKSGKAAKTKLKRKMIVKEGMRKRYYESVKEMQKQELEFVEAPTRTQNKPKTVLDRFEPRKPVKK